MADTPIEPMETLSHHPAADGQEPISADFKHEYAKRVYHEVQASQKDAVALKNSLETLQATLTGYKQRQWAALLQTTVLTQTAACSTFLMESSDITAEKLLAQEPVVVAADVEEDVGLVSDGTDPLAAATFLDAPLEPTPDQQISHMPPIVQELQQLPVDAAISEEQPELSLPAEAANSQIESSIQAEEQMLSEEQTQFEDTIETAFTNLTPEEVKSMQEDFLQRFAKGEMTAEETALLAQLQAELPQGDYSMKAKNPNILETKQVHRVTVQHEPYNPSEQH